MDLRELEQWYNEKISPIQSRIDQNKLNHDQTINGMLAEHNPYQSPYAQFQQQYPQLDQYGRKVLSGGYLQENINNFSNAMANARGQAFEGQPDTGQGNIMDYFAPVGMTKVGKLSNANDIRDLLKNKRLGMYLEDDMFDSVENLDNYIKELKTFAVENELRANVSKAHPTKYDRSPQSERKYIIDVLEKYRNSIKDNLPEMLKPQSGTGYDQLQKQTDTIPEMLKPQSGADIDPNFTAKKLQTNPDAFSIEPKAKKLVDDSGVKVNSVTRGNVLEIGKIETPKELRGKGLAEQKLTEILSKADKDGMKVALTPSSDFGATKSKLIKWYKRHGFVENKGKNKDFTTQESMIRIPK